MAKINTLNYQTVATWDGANDLFIVEQTDGTKVATPAQVKQYVLGDMDDVPTEDSENPVKSGGIFSTIGDLTQTGLTGDSVAEQLDTAREQISGLQNDISSLTGGRVCRHVVTVENNHSVVINLSGSYSTDAEFALVAFNIGGNALAGFALFALGRGSSKIKDLIGSMPNTQYTASYDTTTKKWTITNKCGSTVMITAMLSKGDITVS